jgi:2-C-methyl-D-erythritol 4-phosphate cytidylyltransferase
MKVALVIPAAGFGERLGKGIPKALVDVGGVPLLRRTLNRLAAAADFLETVVLAPPNEVERFRVVLEGTAASLGRIQVAAGGATRQASVARGVEAVGDAADLIAVHDAARPLVSAETVRAVLEAAAEHGAATAASRPSDSVREDRAGGVTAALDRSRLWLVETPQAFRRELLASAHRAAAARNAEYTDDASLVEASGAAIRIVETTGRNLKVTLPVDLRLAAELM